MSPKISRTVLFVPFVILLLNLVLVAGFASSQDSPPPPHWTYEGEDGPQFWGELSPDYALCSAGRAQSPVDITGEQEVNLADLTLNYHASALNIFNNGHTIQVNYDAGSTLIYNENEYQLVQFHFHHPSEHLIDGHGFAMELHLVHRDTNGALAVVGVMLSEGAEENAAYAPIFAHLPLTEGEPAPTGIQINAAHLMPEHFRYFTYLGSLTTPPCAQGVRWLVLDTPVVLSVAQLESFGAIFEMNARPVQPINHRDLLRDALPGG
jgi:carbonic anhydrase